MVYIFPTMSTTKNEVLAKRMKIHGFDCITLSKTVKMKNIFLAMLFPFIVSAQTISAGYFFNLAICNEKASSWGFNKTGQLGLGNNSNSNIPLEINSLDDVTSVAAGSAHAVALKDNGTVWTWGDNSWGQLGNGSNTNSNVPIHINSLTNIVSIAAGLTNSFAVKNDGTVWAWGNNDLGMLGNGTNTGSNIPLQINTLSDVAAISTGNFFSVVLKNDGSVWTMGSNAYGVLGINSNINNSLVPVQVSALNNIIAVSAGYYHCLALKNDGTVWAWGSNGFGELGCGNNTNSTVPIQVTSLTNIIAISGANWFSTALKNDGSVWSWGYNHSGQLGLGTNNNSFIPMAISSLSNIIEISAGAHHTIALKNDGSLWTWGHNNYGQLGDSTYSDKNIPQQINELCLTAVTVDEFLNANTFINISPNPSSDIFAVTPLNGYDMKICVYDLLGKCLWNKYCRKDSSQNIDLSNQPKGIYFIEIVSDGESVVKKIVLQ